MELRIYLHPDRYSASLDGALKDWALKAKSICSLMLVDHELRPLNSLIKKRKTMEKVKKDACLSKQQLKFPVDGFITTDSVRFQMSQNVS